MVQEDVFYFAKMMEKWEEINIFEEPMMVSKTPVPFT